MHILIVTQFFDPEPTLKGMAFAQALRAAGHEVTVLTGFPNYPGGKIYEGYRLSIRQRETIDGVSIVRVLLYPSHDSSGVRRALNYLSFALTATVGILFIKRPDVAYIYHPPGSVALPAIMLRTFRRVPFVYDIQDLWPDTLAASGMLSKSFALKIIGAFMSFVYRRAEHLSVLSPGFKRRLIERGVPEQKITVIPNWAMDENRPNAADANPSADRRDPFVVIFAGTMGKAQALDVVIDAAELLERRGIAVRFDLLGDGIALEELQVEVARRAIGNVRFLPRCLPPQARALMAKADALLVHLIDDPLFAITIPSKTQAYLNTGVPILMGVRGDAADLVKQANAGLCFTPQDAQSLADAVQKMASLSTTEWAAMGKAGADYYSANLSRATGTRRFLELLCDAAANRAR